MGDSVRLKKLKKCMKFNWNFQRGVGGSGRYGSFLELHNVDVNSSHFRVETWCKVVYGLYGGMLFIL